MSATTTTPLADPPPAPVPEAPLRGAPVPPPAYAAWERAVPVPRPLGATACLCLHLPLPLTLVYAATYLLRQQLSGGMPGAADDVAVLAGASAATVVAFGVALAATARRLEPRVRRRTRIGLVASCLVTVVAFAVAGPVAGHTRSSVRLHAGEPDTTAARPLEVGHIGP